MTGGILHAFDLDLCDYVLGQLRPHLRALPGRPGAAARLHPAAWDRLDLPAWLGRRVAGLSAPLADHVWAGVTGDPVERALGDAELAALQTAADDPPMRLEARCVWVPFPGLHRRAVECVPAIRSELTKQTAEEWADESAALAARLCEPSLPLAGGIGVVHDWVRHLRRLVRLMGATHLLPYPLGTHPTPTHPNPPRSRRRRDEPASGFGDSTGRVGAPPAEPAVMLSPAQIASKYAVGRSTVYAACRSGMLAHYRVPATPGARGKYLVKEVDLLAWLETLKSSGEPTTPSASAQASSPSDPASPFSELDPRRLARAWRT